MTAILDSFFITTNLIRLHVVTAGDPHAPPVILLHGFPEFWRGWIKQIEPLAQAGLRVIVPDQRGYNLSDKPKGVCAYRLEELSTDILGLMDALGYEQVYLAGHDWGAAVAWYTAIRCPQRVKKLAILNVPHPVVMSRTLLSSPRQMLKSWYIGFFQITALAEALLGVHGCAGLANMLKRSGKPGTFSAEDMAEYQKAWSQPGALTAMINWYRALVRCRPSLPADGRVHVPTLVLWGMQDVALSHTMAQPSVDLCDDGRLVLFENATHWVQHDEVEAVTRLLVEFFK